MINNRLLGGVKGGTESNKSRKYIRKLLDIFYFVSLTFLSFGYFSFLKAIISYVTIRGVGVIMVRDSKLNIFLKT